jgi:hypothetical protein
MILASAFFRQAFIASSFAQVMCKSAFQRFFYVVAINIVAQFAFVAFYALAIEIAKHFLLITGVFILAVFSVPTCKSIHAIIGVQLRWRLPVVLFQNPSAD